MLRVIGFQYDVAWENRAANFGRLRQMLDEMDEPPAGSLLVLPEMFATGFSLNVEATAEAEPSETLAFMKELATKTRCVVLGGLVTRSEAACEMGRNELRVVEPDGGEIVRYQKVRTFRYTREFDHYERGTEVVTFDWGGLRI
ncbi:MAG: carbon-nitrogen family hydrolase, partial [Verrucomicrobiae bacterium]|nr:carbon-nitrogen family hydrolase [Verrucomicrobiae bacterium]